MSQSFGFRSMRRSRTHPPTRYASKPAFTSVSLRARNSEGTSCGVISMRVIVVHYRANALVVKRISQQSSELLFQVRILAGAQGGKANCFAFPNTWAGRSDVSLTSETA